MMDGDDARIELKSQWKCLFVLKSSRYLVVFARQGGVGFSFEDSFLHIHILKLLFVHEAFNNLKKSYIVLLLCWNHNNNNNNNN